MGDHCEQGPASPSQPAADLVLVEPCHALGGLKSFLDGPSASGDADQFTERDRDGCKAVVEGEFTVAGMAADEQPVLFGLGKQSNASPVVVALPLAAGPAESRCQALLGRLVARVSGRIGPWNRSEAVL